MNITTDIKQKEILGVPGPDKYTNRRLGSDVEADGLLEKVKNIWCIIVRDVDSKELFTFHNYPEYNNVVVIDPDDDLEYTIPPRTGTLENGVEFWKLAAHNGSKLIIHNCGGYDRPLIERFFSDFTTPDDAWHDTFIQSKMQWFDRGTPKGSRGAHGLQGYGCRLGIGKPEVKDWSEMNAFKLHRGIQDTEIQNGTYLYLERERKLVQNKLGIDLLGAWDMENEYRKNVTNQELNGALVDQHHIDNCIIDLDLKIEVLREKIEPNLPPTLNKHSVKISRSEMAMIFYGREVKDSYEMVKVDGEMVRKPVKQYYKPSTYFHRTIKTNSYTAFEISCGASPAFVKKRDLTAWIKENFPKTPPKEWDIEKEIIEVKVLNKNTCDFFEVNEGDGDYIAGPHTRISFKSSVLTQSDVVKSFLVQLGWKDAEEWNNKKDSDGGFVKAEVDTIVRWPRWASPENQMVYKIKKGGLLVTSPKLTDDDYEKLPPGLGEDISHFNTYSHRRRFMENVKEPDKKGLKAYIRPNGRIPCGVNNFNTSSGRSSHSVWVNVAGGGSLYGKECRSIVVAPEDKILVSSDMKSAQLSIASFLANNKDYYKAVAEGQEFIKNEEGEQIYVGESGHCVNARAFTLVTEEEWKRAVKTQDKDLINSITLRRKGSKSGTFACTPIHNTEVLTKFGWKFYKDLKQGMEILTYNKDTKVNEFQPIQKLHYFEDKEVIRMENNEWVIDSTSDHRWLGKRRTGRGKTRREVEEFLTTKDIKSEFKIYNSAPCVDRKNSLVTKEEAAIIGWVLSDGCVSWSPVSQGPSTSFGRKRGVKTVITQNDNKYSKVIKDLLESQGCLTGKTYKNGSVNPCANYNIRSSYFRKLWSKCGFGQQNKKEIDVSLFILKLSNECLESFLDAFFKADGHLTKNGQKCITQNKGNILDGVFTCLTLLGINFSSRSKGVYEPTGNECFDVLFRKKTYTGSTKLIKKSIGVMPTFCVTTENSTFVCKQGNNVTITGNCLFGASGKKVATTLGISEDLGNEKKNSFLKTLGLDNVIDILERMVKKNSRSGGGYMEVPFGYFVWCKQKHKLLNYACQSVEAACQKWAVNYFTREASRLGLDCIKIIDSHDEYLVESSKDCADEVGKLMGKSYEEVSYAVWEWYRKHSKWFVGDDLPDFCFNLDGGYTLGKNYYECH